MNSSIDDWKKGAEELPYKARKIGGSYEAEGHVVAEFKTLAGNLRVVFEFDNPPGLLHIFNFDQIVSLTLNKQ